MNITIKTCQSYSCNFISALTHEQDTHLQGLGSPPASFSVLVCFCITISTAISINQLVSGLRVILTLSAPSFVVSFQLLYGTAILVFYIANCVDFIKQFLLAINLASLFISFLQPCNELMKRSKNDKGRPTH